MPYCEDCKKFRKGKHETGFGDYEGRCTFYEIGVNALSDSCPRAERKNLFIDPEICNRGLTPERRHTGGVNESEFFE